MLDDDLWDQLEGHNDFIAERIQTLSQNTWNKNHEVAINCGIPNWNQDEWITFKNEHNFAGNVMVTFNDFHNRLHQDSQDLNPWTYGIFTYIEKISGTPIPPPDHALGHGMLFPQQNCRIDFAHENGILEVL